MSELHKLEVRGGRKLRDVTALRDRAGSLRTLRLDSCPEISTLDWVRDLAGLRDFALTNSGNVESARPLGSLVNLEYLALYESTRFVDGDLSVIRDLPNLIELRLASRKHYVPSTRELEDAIAAK